MGISDIKASAGEQWKEIKHVFSSKEAFIQYAQVELYVDEDGKVNPWRNEGKTIFLLILFIKVTDCLLQILVQRHQKSEVRLQIQTNPNTLAYQCLAWSWYNWVVFYFASGFGNWTLGSVSFSIVTDG